MAQPRKASVATSASQMSYLSSWVVLAVLERKFSLLSANLVMLYSGRLIFVAYQIRQSKLEI